MFKKNMSLKVFIVLLVVLQSLIIGGCSDSKNKTISYSDALTFSTNLKEGQSSLMTYTFVNKSDKDTLNNLRLHIKSKDFSNAFVVKNISNGGKYDNRLQEIVWDKINIQPNETKKLYIELQAINPGNMQFSTFIDSTEANLQYTEKNTDSYGLERNIPVTITKK